MNETSLNDDGYGPLFFAVCKGHYNLINFLIIKGADPHLRNDDGVGMLHAGAWQDQPVSLAYILAFGVDINTTDN